MRFPNRSRLPVVSEARAVKVRRTIALALCAGLGFHPARASTVVVPDDSSTVQLGIDSGADTILVREGTYDETPRLERDLVLRGIGVSRRPRLNGLQLTN